MPTLDITDDHADRIEALREELAAAHAGPYASVDREDAVAYLLDLADAVDDPDRLAEATQDDDSETPDAAADEEASGAPFDRDRARELLSARNRKHGDPDAADEMDLYSIAAAFDVTGRSDMTKAELIDAVLDAAAALSADPFSQVDVDFGDDEAGAGEATDEPTGDGADDEAGAGEATDEPTESEDAGDTQLNAMMSLLDTHEDKWREADGDARYEVELPDGDVETARTKDDVRALLFKNY